MKINERLSIADSSASHSNYLKALINPELRTRMFQDFLAFLEHNKLLNSFDFVAGQGLSGTLATTYGAQILDKYPIYVRKSTATCHASTSIEMPFAPTIDSILSYIIIDDTVASGRTVQKIVEILSLNFRHTKLFGLAVLNRIYYYDITDYIDAIRRIRNLLPEAVQEDISFLYLSNSIGFDKVPRK